MKRLKLIALDAEDLAVISAHCQDAVMKTGDVNFLPAEKRFVITMNRFVWEEAEKRGKQFERRRSVLHFERVERVSALGVDRKNKERVLDLLAVTFNETAAPAGTIELAFAGGATVRLEVECVEAQLTDMAAAWEAGSRPNHEKAG